MKNYEKVANYVGKSLKTRKSNRLVKVVDENNRFGFIEDDKQVTIFAQFYIDHDSDSILDYLNTKCIQDVTESVEEKNDALSSLTKKELLDYAASNGIKVNTQMKKDEIIEVLNAN